MNKRDNATEQLKAELQALQYAYEALKTKYENDSFRHLQALHSLEEGERRFWNFYQNAPVNYQSLDANACLIDVNPTWLNTLGYEREEVIGKPFCEFMTPESAELVKTRFPFLKEMGVIRDFEFEMIRKDGTHLFATFEGKVSLDEQGDFKQTHCIWTDSTKRKLAETALQESERRFRELIELAVDGIMIGSHDGTIIGANTYMQNLTGRPLNKLLGINIRELFSPNVLKNNPLRYDLLEKGEVVSSERDIMRADGTIIPIEMHTKMMPDGTYQSIYRDISESIKAEETLRQSEEKYKSLVESTSDIIWETDKDGLYTYVSPQIENILGYAPEKFIGKSPYDYIDDALLSELNSRQFSTDDVVLPFYLLVNRFKHSDGHAVFFETSGVPVYEKSGILRGFRGVSRDISARHLAEKELHKLSLVVHQNPNTIIITDLDGKMVYINPAGCINSGYSSDELIGESPSIFASGATPAESYKSLWSSIKAGIEWKGIFHNKRKNGEFYWESAFIVPLRDTEGVITQYLGVKEDITTRVQTEKALIESEERYRELFEASPDAIILADIETGMLLDANTAACRLMGYTPDEVVQLHESLIHPPAGSGFSNELIPGADDKAHTVDTHQHYESHIHCSDGTEIPVEVLSNIITINGRQIRQGVFRNITERKQAREALLIAKENAEASDKLKSAFLNNISHELRTPLNGIIGFSEMITQPDISKAERAEFSKMINRSSARLVNTITNYMDISMIVSGITEVNLSKFNLKTLLETVNNQTAEKCVSLNLPVSVILNSPREGNQITTDESMLLKIFTHLVDNAVKFTPKGTITIGYEFLKGIHTFSVSDTGKGISKEMVSRIFDFFMQADLSTTRDFEGSGLGLSIARGYVKILGGELWVESVSNQGSTFYFTLPDKYQSHANGKSPQALQQSEPVVLIAEDDDSNFRYIEVVLKKSSYKVLRAINGYETLEICRTNPDVKILLMDLKMPGMDGFEATRQIRQFLPELPIVVLSAYISLADEEAARSAGCNDYITKPVSKAKLLETLDRLLHLSEKQFTDPIQE